MKQDITTLKQLSEFEENNEIKVFCEQVPHTICCPKCGYDELEKYGTRYINIKDLPRRGKHTTLVIQRRRLRCKNRTCGLIFLEPVQCKQDKFLITSRLYNYIKNAKGNRTLKETYASLSGEIGISFHGAKKIHKN